MILYYLKLKYIACLTLHALYISNIYKSGNLILKYLFLCGKHQSSSRLRDTDTHESERILI